MESHHCRAKTKRRYLDSKLSITKLHELYVESVKQESSDAVVSFQKYQKVFCSIHNLSFFKPRKDQCGQCAAYENMDPLNPNKEEQQVNKTNFEMSSELGQFDGSCLLKFCFLRQTMPHIKSENATVALQEKKTLNWLKKTTNCLWQRSIYSQFCRSHNRQKACFIINVKFAFII